MTQANINTTVEQAIISALRPSDRNLGELSDITGEPYSTLEPVLRALQAKGMVESYFQNKDACAVLTYHLRSLWDL